MYHDCFIDLNYEFSDWLTTFFVKFGLQTSISEDISDEIEVAKKVYL